MLQGKWWEKGVRNKQSKNIYFISVTHRLTYGKYINMLIVVKISSPFFIWNIRNMELEHRYFIMILIWVIHCYFCPIKCIRFPLHAMNLFILKLVVQQATDMCQRDEWRPLFFPNPKLLIGVPSACFLVNEQPVAYMLQLTFMWCFKVFILNKMVKPMQKHW